MKEYLHMDDVFDLRLMDACKLSVKPSCVWSAWDDGVTPHEYAAHAINQHDELVEMNRELLEALDEVWKLTEFAVAYDGINMSEDEKLAIKAVIAKAKGESA